MPMAEVTRTPLRFGQLLAAPGVVEQVELRGKVGFCAYHGGNLERRTEVIATEAARLSGASLYTVTQPRSMRHHIPSAHVDPSESPRFAAFVEHCDYVITVHGYGRQGLFSSLLCGGQNRALAGHVADHIRHELAAYTVLDSLDQIPKSLRGLHPHNPCNITTGGGMQLELPPRVRGLTPMADYWPCSHADTSFPHINRLVVALAAAAASWHPEPYP